MREKKPISAVWCAAAGIFSVLILTLLDQYTKLLALTHLRQKPGIPLIQGVLELKYLENRGIAFGMFQGKVAVFVVLCLVFLAAALYVFIRMPKEKYFLPLMLITFLIVAGALGNFIDRLFRGFVVDFIYFSIIDFPIFNVADIYVTLSVIALLILIFFHYKEEDFQFFRKKKKENAGEQ